MEKKLFEIVVADEEKLFRNHTAADDFDAALKAARDLMRDKNCEYIIKVEQTATIWVV